MRVAAIAFFIAAGAAHPSLAGDVKISPAPSAGQELRYISGRPAVVSHGTAGAVVLILAGEVIGPKDGVRLVLAARNLASTPTNLTEADISASTDTGPANVMSMADMEAAERARIKGQIKAAKWRAVAAAMQGAGAAMQEGSTGTYNAQANRYGNTTYVSGTYTPPRDTTYEQQLADRNMRAAQGDIAAARASMPEAAAPAAANGFRATTIEPGQDAVTLLPLDRLPKKAAHLTVAVMLNGERHAFEFNVAPLGR